jgi:hypothetical protein
MGFRRARKRGSGADKNRDHDPITSNFQKALAKAVSGKLTSVKALAASETTIAVY